MASWWRLIATDLGASGSGSWKRKCAAFRTATTQTGDNWPRKIVEKVTDQNGNGSWDRRLVGTTSSGTWARQIRNNGLPV